MKTQKRIYAFHLLNDYSGSPKVLSQILKEWVKNGNETHLYTSLHQDGFLSNINGIKYHEGWYKFQKNPWLRLCFFTLSQLILIIKMFHQIKKNDLVYINTVLPFGAALLGKIKGCEVIYHIHESTVNPQILKCFLFGIVKQTANKIINVSKYVQQSHGITNVKNHLVYNSIDNDFVKNILPKKAETNYKNVLMVCSLKTYKGVYEFTRLAFDHPNFEFKLVLNAPQKDIDDFFSSINMSENISIYAAQKNLHPFFQWADVIVNLSKPDGWIETFGLTIIEGMAYGLPAIVPPIGGILEVIEEGLTGFSVDSRDTQQLNLILSNVLKNKSQYEKLSHAAFNRLQIFKEEFMLKNINEIVFQNEY